MPPPTEPGSTSASLIALARAHDAAAWSRLCAIYGPLVYYWLRRSGLSDSDAADLGQETFLVVLRRLPEFDGSGPSASFRGWLRVIVRNKVGNWLRKRPPTEAIDAANEPVAWEPASDATERIARNLLLHRALEAIRVEFEERTWHAFWRTVIEDQESRLVAETLSMTPQAVRQARYRVLHRLRTLMKDDWDA